MPTPSDDIAGLRASAEDILREGRFQNFAAQSHSRDVLRQMHIPEAEWPAYTPAIDEDLVYAAQTLLYVGLRLKRADAGSADADIYLTRGAEILEYVYARADDGDPERVCQLFSAALAYYMAGHFARAFVLVRDLEAETPLPRFLRPLRHLLMKEFRPLRVEVLRQLFRSEYEDAELAAAVSAGVLDEDAALCRVLEATLYRALSYFLEHVRTGAPDLLASAEKLVEDGTEVAVGHKFADWWWYYSCVRVMLATFRRHSLWTNLGPFFARPETSPLARRYVRANLRLPTPVTELWPSQVTAVPHLFDPAGRKNLCIRMPTSAGKTKIAELAILAQMTSGVVDPDFKCVYVAPFRSLAVEVEQALRLALRPLGLRVSELYGGFELTAADRLLIETTQVLVATPEKVDAFVRFSPDLAGQIRLVILDEGHIIEPPDFRSLRQSRGLKYEVFLQRLVTRCEKAGARIVFLSAVMPNADQFAEWITGDKAGLVSSDWRPSRLMLGEAVWTGTAVDLEYTHADRQSLGHKCFVRGFVKQWPAGAVGSKRRKADFPQDGNEALALTALELARHKLTMVFVAQKRSAEPLGKTLLKCLSMRRMIAESAGEQYELSIDPRHHTEVGRCIDLIREHLGEDSDHVEFLRAGFVIHHSGIPQPVRIAVERLVRSGAVRLVVATTTLAQGVNFPIHTVLVHSLDQGKNEPVSPMDFWNICGRAGRGMKENEGQVLFFAKQCFPEWQAGRPDKFRRCPPSWQKKKWREWCDTQRAMRTAYVSQYGAYQVESGLLHLVRQVERLWQERHGSVDVPQLCEALADHTLDMFAPSEEVDLETLLSTLDGLLIAMTEECEAEEITPDTFQALLHRSLVHLQLASPDQRQRVNDMFAARVRHIRAKHPDRGRRRLFYQLGLPLRDCEAVEARKDDLLALYLKAVEYDRWSVQERADHLADIAAILFRLTEIAPNGPVPDCWRRILALWLDGLTPPVILADPEVAAAGVSANDLGRWIDDVFAYRLPWGLNSIGTYLKQYAEAGGSPWPAACEYYSSFVKYGVNQPGVCWLLAVGLPSRAAAIRIGGMIGARVDKPESLVPWLRSGGIELVLQEGLAAGDAELLRAAVLRDAARSGEDGARSLTVAIPRGDLLGPAPESGTRVLVEPAPGGGSDRYRLLDLSGAVIHEFDWASDLLAEIMATPEFVTAEVVESTGPDFADRMQVRIEAI